MNDAPFILVVEDHQKIRTNTLLQLREDGFAAHGVASAEEAHEWLQTNERPELMLLDVRLGGATGVELIRRLASEGGFPPTIIISGEASISETVEALRLGVYDLIEKPFTRERLLQSVRNCLEHTKLKRELVTLQSRVRDTNTIVGRSPQVSQLRERIAKVAGTNTRVMIRGESGTGKELVAATLHRQSARRDGPFVKINCAAIPAHLIEDELFGHARGAFTDAKTAKPGLFEEANRGTLFLDEIGDMELTLQSRLLRVLEDGKVRRVGENHDRQVDVRVLAATNRPLEQFVSEGRFREDLYFRLATVPIEVPPLRERTGDVALLFAHFLEHFCTQNQTRRLTIDAEVLPIIERYRWPGNVRELRNVCEQLAIFGTNPITRDQLPSAMLADQATTHEAGLVRFTDMATIIPLREFKEQCEKEYIESVLRRMNWNFSAAARQLDIQRTYLHQKIAALGIEKPK
ncbi:MAG TPA: sigma-54 dependent transcriptional regulator [Thermoanaerobaculia bacterium]|jgi:two-component system nitrogen regulation response regulator NtrX